MQVSHAADCWAGIGSKLLFVKKDMGQTSEHQRHFEWPIIDLHGEVRVDSIQTSLKLLFTLQQ